MAGPIISGSGLTVRLRPLIPSTAAEGHLPRPLTWQLGCKRPGC